MIMTVKCMASEECDLLVIVMMQLFGSNCYGRFSCYCHGVIFSASCLFDDHDCEMLYGHCIM